HRLLTDIGRKQIVLDFSDADFLPSTGLGKLVMLNRKLQAVQGRLALCHLAPLVQESLEHTRLTPLFNIYGTEAEALESFEKGENGVIPVQGRCRDRRGLDRAQPLWSSARTPWAG